MANSMKLFNILKLNRHFLTSTRNLVFSSSQAVRNTHVNGKYIDIFTKTFSYNNFIIFTVDPPKIAKNLCTAAAAKETDYHSIIKDTEKTTGEKILQCKYIVMYN